MVKSDPADVVAGFYDRWANLYANAVRHAPGVGRLRRLTIEELELDTGATVVDMGCGPGVNFPYLTEYIGQDGRLVGVDIAPEMLKRAARVDPASELVLGDGSRPPIGGEIDAVLATFVVTLFEDPEQVVDAWWSTLAPGGRLAMLNLGPMRGLAGALGNPLLRIGLRLTTPNAGRFDRNLLTVLDERMQAAQHAVEQRADRIVLYDSADGLFRVVVGTKPIHQS